MPLAVSLVAIEVGSAAEVAFLDEEPGVKVYVSGVVARQRSFSRFRLIDEAPIAEVLAADVVVCSLTGSPVERGLVSAAKQHRVPTLQYLDTWGPYHHRMMGPLADAIAVIDGSARKEAEEAGADPQSLRVVGQPAWERVSPLPPAPAGRMAFLSQPISRLYGGSLGYDESSAFALLKRFQIERPDLVSDLAVVPHPAGCALSGTKDAVSLDQALRSSGTIVGMFSSAMVDALLGGRSVLSFQPLARMDDVCALSRFGWVPRALSPEELPRLLARPRGGECEELRNALTGSRDRFLELIHSLGRGR